MDIAVQGQDRQLQEIILPSRSRCQVNNSSISASQPIADVITPYLTSMIIKLGSKPQTLTLTKQQRQIILALKIGSIVVLEAISMVNTIRLRGPPKTHSQL